ncbi:hypothetical protein MMC28_007403 [Mycoblastus sanguinarius]|nr:hypothetical protein [Mycoblastus sanguinarius]
MHILDIGCGPGTITADLAALVPAGQVVGIDSGSYALELARSTATERGLKNICFKVGDAHALDYPEGFFDVVHAHQVLQYVSDPIRALREMRRVTKPGGMIACREADAGSASYYPEIRGVVDFQNLYVEVARSRGGEPDGGRHLITWARKAGIDRSDITATASVWCFSSPDERAWWSGMWVNRLTNSSVANILLDSGCAAQEDLNLFMHAWREWGAHDDGWWTLTHGEILCHV